MVCFSNLPRGMPWESSSDCLVLCQSLCSAYEGTCDSFMCCAASIVTLFIEAAEIQDGTYYFFSHVNLGSKHGVIRLWGKIRLFSLFSSLSPARMSCIIHSPHLCLFLSASLRHRVSQATGYQKKEKSNYSKEITQWEYNSRDCGEINKTFLGQFFLTMYNN